MKHGIKQRDLQYALLTFALCAVAGLAFVLPFRAAGNGIYYLGLDYVEQQIPFWSYCNDAVKSGRIWWSAVNDLGTSFVGAYSFYVLGSPFFWFSLLLPAEKIYTWFGFLLVLKMAVAGLGAYAYCRQYLKDPAWGVAAGLLYAFCGYQIGNMNFNHFYDVTALFPFLLLALDAAFMRGRRGGFAVMAALCALCNPVFFFGEVVFLILYTAVRLACGAYRLTARLFARLAFESLAGVGLGAFLVLPAFLELLGNPRATNAGYSQLWEYFILRPIYWAELIRGSLFPAECIFDRAFFVNAVLNGAELYLPLFGMVLVAAFVWQRRRHWVSRVLLLSVLFAVVPVLNSLFSMLNAEYYPRWQYMPLLLCALATAMTLDDLTLRLKPGCVWYGLLWLALGGVAFVFTRFLNAVFISNGLLAMVFAGISLSGFGLTLWLRGRQKKNPGSHTLILGVLMLYCIAGGVLNSYYHQRARTPESVEGYYTASQRVDTSSLSSRYRLDTDLAFRNLGTVLRHPSVTSFTSSISGSLFRFYEAMGIPRTVNTLLGDGEPELKAFLSARYRVTSPADGVFVVAENEDALPMGFCFTEYMTEEEFSRLEADEKRRVLLRALVLPDEQAAAGILPHAQLPDLLREDVPWQADAKARAENAAEDFRYTQDGFAASFTGDTSKLLFFTVPYDSGWRAEVNGKSAEILRADAGFMAVETEPGQNRIIFRFHPRGFTAGILLSGASALLLMVYGAWPWLRRSRRTR